MVVQQETTSVYNRQWINIEVFGRRFVKILGLLLDFVGFQIQRDDCIGAMCGVWDNISYQIHGS